MRSNRHYVAKNGYRKYYNPKSPDADRNGFAPVHRDVARRKYNRDIRPYEVVHHRDGNKLNNSRDNLQIMSRSRHTRLHNRQRAQSADLGCATILATVALFVTAAVLLLFGWLVV